VEEEGGERGKEEGEVDCVLESAVIEAKRSRYF